MDAGPGPSGDSLRTEDLRACTLREIRRDLSRSFEDYCVPLRVSDHTVDGLLTRDGASLLLSRRLLDGERFAGLALVARRGRSCRFLAMGIVPELRGRGLGRWFMRRLIAEARERGERSIWLEAFECNEKAVRLHESLGFRKVRRLVGWRAEEVLGAEGRAEEIDPAEAARRIGRTAVPDAPWMVSGEALCHLGAECRAFALGNAAAIVQFAGQAVQIHGLPLSPSPTTLQQPAEVIRHAAHALPKAPWVAPPCFPEEILGQTMVRLGFAPDPHAQAQYLLTLSEEG